MRERRRLVAFAFGLVHGIGFASVLADLGLHGANLTLALVRFNAGVTVCYLRVFTPVGSGVNSAIAAAWLVIRAMGNRG